MKELPSNQSRSDGDTVREPVIGPFVRQSGKYHNATPCSTHAKQAQEKGQN